MLLTTRARMRKREVRKWLMTTLGELRGKTKPQQIDYLRKCVVDKESYSRRAAIAGVKLEVAREVVREDHTGTTCPRKICPPQAGTEKSLSSVGGRTWVG